MNEFINKHPYITWGIIYITCNTLVNIAKILKGTPIQPIISGIHVITKENPIDPKDNEPTKKEEQKEEIRGE
jgi:hypothetical protein